MNDSAYCIASLIFADTTLCFSRVELIGEEIYDEFDPQGHPDLSSYVQAEAKAAPSLKRTGSAPQLAAMRLTTLARSLSSAFGFMEASSWWRWSTRWMATNRYAPRF